MAAPYVFWLLPVLFCPKKECHDLPSRTVLVDAERSLLRSRRIAGRDLVLITPENGFIESVRRRNILERGFSDRLRGWLAFHPPQEHHALATAHIAVNTERAVRIALGDAFLGSPENCLVEGMRLRDILKGAL